MNDKKQLDKEAYLAGAAKNFSDAQFESDTARIKCKLRADKEISLLAEEVRKNIKKANDFNARGLKFLEMAEQLEKE